MGPQRGKAVVAAAAAVALAAATIIAIVGLGGPRDPAPLYSAPAAPPGAPNLLVVSLDDQSVSELDRKAMPRVLDFFDTEGTWFDQAIAAPPLCCPSRAGFLTGRYPHNHEVVENAIGYRSMAGKERTFPVALQAAGYRTGMIGKFLNGYEPAGGSEPAPGFDRWFAIYGYAGYTDFQVSDDGELGSVSEYATDRLTDEAIEFVSDSGDEPFFLWLSYNAPHTVAPGSPPPCDGTDAQPPDADTYERFANEALPRPPSFNERDVSDKPSYEEGPGRLKPRELEELTQTWRCARASLAGVDEGFGRLVDELGETGEVERTIIVYLSDNGFYFGEHRIAADKRLPLEPALRVPMAVSVGDEIATAAGPARSDELVSQVDLAPTLADYAGIDACEGRERCVPFDGRSLRPLLDGREPGGRASEGGSSSSAWPENRAIPLTLDEGWAYDALRTQSELYMELTRARQARFDRPISELYDLVADPHQLRNIAGSQPRRAAALRRRMNRLLDCAGIEGRDERLGNRPFCK